MSPEQQIDIINHLSGFILEKRLELLKHVLSNRTRYLTVVLEDIYQSQNASAVLRTCDCLGVQDIHIIENRNPFNINPRVVMGATKWLSLYRYKDSNSNNTKNAINLLKNKGYRIVATSPHTYQTSLNDFDIEKGKFALLFGTELTGLSETVLNQADEFIMIPTYGFSESLNISVSAAVCIYTLTQRLRSSDIITSLPDDEYNQLMHEWLRKAVKSWRLIEKRFIATT
jgi:tRNA (guanosine-2'-O-)-methyltransferase